MAYDLDAEDRHRSEVSREEPGAYRRTFRPVVVRERHDGWTCDKQAAFIERLGECGCVTEACAAVGMTTAGAYRLKARYDAVDFRVAWDAALDMAVGRVEDGVLARAINGVAVPHYYQGEQIGEHRRYDERLALFILRYRKPTLYGKFRDAKTYTGDPEALAERFAVAVDLVQNDASRTMFEDESAEAAVAHLARDTAAAASAADAADRAAAQAETATARAAETGDATDAKIAAETDDWAVGLAHEAMAAEALVDRTREWVAHAAAVFAARDTATNQAGGNVPQPSHTSAHDANRKGSSSGAQHVNSRKRARRRRQGAARSG